MALKSVLYVITKAGWGGAQRYVFDLATAAKERGYAVAVAYGEGGLLARRLEEAGIRTISVPSLQRDVSMLGEFRALFALIAFLRKERPDVLHINSSKAGFIGGLAGRIIGIPRIIFTAHGWAFNEERPAWQKSVFRFLHQMTVALSHATICVSEATARDIQTRGNAHKLSVIHNGITCDSLLEKSVAREHLLPGKKDAYWIGMLAELHRTKRVDLAIEAFSRIKDVHPEAILVVMGEGEERAHLEILIREKQLTDRVFLLGFVKDGPSYLSALDLLVLPSRTEAFAYVALEAGCASLPVIAAKVGGIPEVIENDMTGILVPSGDAVALSGAMEEFMNNPEKARELGARLNKRVRKDFSEERAVRETLARY